MNQFLVFGISRLLKSSTGSRETFTFAGELRYPELEFSSKAEGGVEIMRIEYGFNVVLKDFKVDVRAQCVRCLKQYPETVKVDHEECQFYMEAPREVLDPDDLYLVDMKKLSIDLSEFVRQEIILHFPSNPVCSGSHEELSYADETVEEHKPLSKLKELLK